MQMDRGTKISEILEIHCKSERWYIDVYFIVFHYILRIICILFDMYSIVHYNKKSEFFFYLTFLLFYDFIELES